MKLKLYPSSDFTIGNELMPGMKPQDDTWEGYIDADPYYYGYKNHTFYDLEECREAFKKFVTDKGIRQAQRKKRGLNGISSDGRRKVRSAAVLMEQKFGKDRLTFGTATLPTFTREQEATLCQNFGEIKRQFFQELTRMLERCDLPTCYVQVTEIQDKRLTNRDEFAPHLHWIMVGKKSIKHHWSIRPEQIRNLWQRILYNVTGIAFDCTSATRIEPIKYSATGYISKYMSKGCQSAEYYLERRSEEYLPSSWYGITKRLKDAIRENTVILYGDIVEKIVRNLLALKENGIVWFAPVNIPLNKANPTELTNVGFVGRISRGHDIWSLLHFIEEGCHPTGN